jgi:O-antigen/teichoic acid export membrane protein
MTSKLRTLGKETAIYGTSTVLVRMLNFIMLPFYTYLLSPERYGIVATVYSYIAFITILFQYGMDQAYMRYTSADREKETLFFACTFWPLLCSSALFVFLIWLARMPLAGMAAIGAGSIISYAQAGRIITYSGIVMALDAITCVPFAKLRLEHRAFSFASIKIANILINIAANVLFLYKMRMGPEGVLLASVAASTVSLALLLPLFYRSIKPIFVWPQFEEMWHFAWPFIPAGLAAMVVQVIDRPLMAKLAGLHAAGIYQAGYRLGIFMMLIVSMFDQAWRPFVMENAKAEGSKELFARVFTYFTLFGTGAVLALSLFIEVIVKINFFGRHLIAPAYWEGLCVVPIVLAAYLFNGFYINFMAGPILTKKTKIIVGATAAGAISNIIANLILIPTTGMMGAAWATFLSYVLMALVMYFGTRKDYPIPYEFVRVGQLLMVALGLWIIHYPTDALCMDAPGTGLLCRLGLLAAFPLLLLLNGFFPEEELSEMKNLFLRRILRRKIS